MLHPHSLSNRNAKYDKSVGYDTHNDHDERQNGPQAASYPQTRNEEEKSPESSPFLSALGVNKVRASLGK